MIVDASALVALVLQEPGFESIRRRLASADRLAIGAPTVVELKIVLTAKGIDADVVVGRLVKQLGLAIVPFHEEHARLAASAFRKYGKGRHKAALDFGDCLTYAIAKLADEPLLCAGDDFPRTDLAVATSA